MDIVTLDQMIRAAARENLQNQVDAIFGSASDAAYTIDKESVAGIEKMKKVYFDKRVAEKEQRGVQDFYRKVSKLLEAQS